MKKIISAALAAAMCFASVAALTGCSDDIADIRFDTKYILDYQTDSVEAKQSYVTFSDDYTGKYKCYSTFGSYSSNDDYTVFFKWTYVDADKSTVVCFYDSAEIGSYYAPSTRPESDWTMMMSVSKNVVMTVGSSGYRIYINEEYLKELPNFGK